MLLLSNMSWHQLSLNPQALDSLYSAVPELERVELHSIKLHRDGSRLQIVFELPTFPDKPAARWQQGLNIVQINLSFWSVRNFEARGWQENMQVRIEMKRSSQILKVVITDPEIDLRFAFTCEFFRIEKLSPYQNGRFENDSF